MELFKKKTPKKITTPKTSMKISDFYNELSSVALQAEYNQLQDDFKQNPSEKTAKILQMISKILNDRAYEQGNGKLMKEALSMLPSLTKEKFESMSKEEKENLQRLIDKKKDLDMAIRNLNEPEPEVEITLELNEDPNENEVINTEKEKITLINEVEVETPKPKKPGFFKKKKRIIRENEVQRKPEYKTHEPFTPEEQIEYSQKQKKQSLFSKPIGDVFKKKQVTPEQKQRALQMQKATEAKEGASLKNLFNSKKKEKIKLPDVICPDCTHPLKSHQSKGESTGCKCGCLLTVEDIAKKQGIQLHRPEEVLTRIKEESEQVTNPEITEPNTKEIEPEFKEVIQQQAKQLTTMKKNTVPSQQVSPEIKTEPPRKAKSLCANCDHVPKSHFDDVGFCTVIGCTCENYRAYPE